MDSLYSPSWYQVAELRPRLSSHVTFCRHVYRAEPWFVLHNPTTGRTHRLTPAAHSIVAGMDGRSTTQQLWDRSLSTLGDDCPTQEETVQLLGKLHAADVLRCDVPPDTEALFRDAAEQEARELRGRLNPISFRLPLFDPDALLTRLLPGCRVLFSRTALWLYFAVVAIAGLSALQNAPELAAGARGLLEPGSLAALWFAYPIVKALHELSHGLAVKYLGGEVHEVGVLFLVFIPVPYVDASASSVFPEKRQRMAVSAAGIAAELVLAAVATLLWFSLEPGFVRQTAYAVMMIGGISTLLFNGNPLLRFDGYYVLADWLEIPNLSGKAQQYLGGWARRKLLGLRDAPLPDRTRGETFWLVSYGIASALYRVAVMFGIALYLAGRFFVLGVALAAFTLVMRLVVPILKQARFVLVDPTVGEDRLRAVTGSFGLAGLLVVAMVALPIPLHTRSEGIVWLPERAHVRAATEGFVTRVLATPHRRVALGDPLILTRDPSIEARAAIAEAKVRELRSRLQAVGQLNAVELETARASLSDAEAELSRVLERVGDTLMTSPSDGVFVTVDGKDLEGRFVGQGEVVAYVVDDSGAVARVVVLQADAALLRERTNDTWVRFAHDLGTVHRARIKREVPAASDRLPTPALGSAFGGPVAVDPQDPKGLQTLNRIFQFDVALPENATGFAAGERVYVRFDHGAEPLAKRGYRAARRVLLKELGV